MATCGFRASHGATCPTSAAHGTTTTPLAGAGLPVHASLGGAAATALAATAVGAMVGAGAGLFPSGTPPKCTNYPGVPRGPPPPTPLASAALAPRGPHLCYTPT